MPLTAPAADVVVLGGGIAGIAAAIHLRDAGGQVTLIEARKFLGGRAFSFIDAATGQPVDNGQHIILGCCTQFLQFLERLGVRQGWQLQPRLRLPVLNRQGRVGVLAAAPLPAPFHLLPSFIRYPHLSPGDKLRVMAGMARARFTDRTRPRLQQITFHQWLREQGQSEPAIRNLWNLVVEPALNDNVRQVSAAMGLMIIQEGMLKGRRQPAGVGYPRDGLLPAIGAPALRLLDRLGVRVMLGQPVRSITLAPRRRPAPGDYPSPARAAGVELASGAVIPGRAFVSALPFSGLLRALPAEAVTQAFFERIGNLTWSPIVNLHLWYDRPVLNLDFCVLVDSPLQWVFNKSRILDTASSRPGQYLSVSVSAAWDYIDRPREELTDLLVNEMAVVFPEARKAKLERALLVKQRQATFRCLPGAGQWRPGPLTPVSNLYLAGEWTDTGWPSTMEGAVRSGRNAARAALHALPGLSPSP